MRKPRKPIKRGRKIGKRVLKRRSPAAKALGSRLYRQRVKPGKKRRYVPGSVTPVDMARILLGDF